MIPTFAAFILGLSAPSAPTLSYTAQGQFTITNYNASLTYVVSGATRSGNLLTSVSNGATITAAYSAGAPVSAASTMNVLANARILSTPGQFLASEGCGPRPNLCCPSGQILNTAGESCGGSPGTIGPDYLCSNSCPGYCFTLYMQCYYWYWTNYTSSGYTLIGGDSGTWGKATNG
jgi:hypothetical protein